MRINKDIFKKMIPYAFSVCLLGLISMIFLFGSTLNTVKYKTDILVLSNYYKKCESTHLKVDSDFNNMDSTELNKASAKIKQISPEINLTYSIADKGYLTYYAYSENISIYSMPTYSDKGFMEWGKIPLYGDEKYSIKKGPLFGARFPSYVPSSIASSLCSEFNIGSFDELLDYGVVYNVFINGYKYTFSINNIYYNQQTKYWSVPSSDLEGTYFDNFTRWNPNGIFTYGHSIYRENQRIEFTIDYECSYSVTDAVIKQVLEMDARGYDFSFYDGDNPKSQATIKTLSQKDLTNEWTSSVQIITYIISSVLVTIMIIIFSLSGNFRQSMEKILILFSCFLAFIFIVSEILKTAFPGVYLIFFIFNSFGMAITLILILLLFTVAIAVHKERKHE